MSAAEYLNRGFGLSSVREVDGKLLISRADYDMMSDEVNSYPTFTPVRVKITAAYGLPVVVCDE